MSSGGSLHPSLLQILLLNESQWLHCFTSLKALPCSSLEVLETEWDRHSTQHSLCGPSLPVEYKRNEQEEVGMHTTFMGQVSGTQSLL